MCNEKAMGDFLSEARSILDKIEVHNEVHEQQLLMYEKMMNNSISLHRERMDSFERRWANTRNVLIGIVGIFLLSFVSDKIELDKRPTEEEIDAEYLSKEDAYRGLGVVIDDTYDTMENTGDLTKDEAKELSTQTKRSVLKEIDPDRVERSVKIVK